VEKAPNLRRGPDKSETTSFDGLVFASSPLATPVVGGRQPVSRCDIAGAAAADVIARLGRFVR
jgi:hypothetical protein